MTEAKFKSFHPFHGACAVTVSSGRTHIAIATAHNNRMQDYIFGRSLRIHEIFLADMASAPAWPGSRPRIVSL